MDLEGFRFLDGFEFDFSHNTITPEDAVPVFLVLDFTTDGGSREEMESTLQSRSPGE